MMDSAQLDDWFESAYIYLSTHEKISMSNDNKLKLYALFKQVIIGDCNGPKPSLFEFVARAKWDAWKAIYGMPPNDAKEGYISLVESLKVGWSRAGEYKYEGGQDELSTWGTSVSTMSYEKEEETEEDLFSLTCAGNVEKVRERVTKHNESVDSKDEEGLTPLHHACDRGYPDMVEALIELGANINAQVTNIVFVCVCFFGDFDSYVGLLNRQTHWKHLFTMVGCNTKSVVDWNINIVLGDLTAYISEQLETAKILHSHKCDTSLRDEDGKTASEQADPEFVSRLAILL
ncbi:hypothetical protein CLU79DRAFT_698043 [Phycomyces nitens]|nr:hypothetical protein CLU79DRAFT_698043 [Phycomyces nitens]